MQTGTHGDARRERDLRRGRVARGTLAAIAATLLAAASHALGGAAVTPLSVAATVLLSWPICVALAGRVASLWRLSAAVAVSQFLYHWSFAGLGIPSGAATAARSGGPHASHAVEPIAFAPSLTAAADAGALMWGAHAIAALATIALVVRGERALRTLGRLLRRVLFPAVPRPQPRPQSRTTRRRGASGDAPAGLRERLCSLSAISHRGPPFVRFA